MKFTISLLIILLPLLLLASPAALPIPEDGNLESEIAERAVGLNAFLTLLLKYLPALNAAITSLVGVLTVFENFLVILTGQKVTYNEITGVCKPYTLLFARGTTEPGNIGILVGPPLLMALSPLIPSPSLSIQGVNSYAASVTGYLAGGDALGSSAMAAQITALRLQCPDTKLVVGGYSQGGQLVHNALALVGEETAAWVAKVVVFGDPYNGRPIPGVSSDKVLTFCHPDDDICSFGYFILPAHLTYGLDVVKAAAFIVS